MSVWRLGSLTSAVRGGGSPEDTLAAFLYALPDTVEVDRSNVTRAGAGLPDVRIYVHAPDEDTARDAAAVVDVTAGLPSHDPLTVRRSR